MNLDQYLKSKRESSNKRFSYGEFAEAIRNQYIDTNEYAIDHINRLLRRLRERQQGQLRGRPFKEDMSFYLHRIFSGVMSIPNKLKLTREYIRLTMMEMERMEKFYGKRIMAKIKHLKEYIAEKKNMYAGDNVQNLTPDMAERIQDYVWTIKRRIMEDERELDYETVITSINLSILHKLEKYFEAINPEKRLKKILRGGNSNISFSATSMSTLY